jgi:hypothetical protein
MPLDAFVLMSFPALSLAPEALVLGVKSLLSICTSSEGSTLR